MHSNPLCLHQAWLRRRPRAQPVAQFCVVAETIDSHGTECIGSTGGMPKTDAADHARLWPRQKCSVAPPGRRRAVQISFVNPGCGQG